MISPGPRAFFLALAVAAASGCAAPSGEEEPAGSTESDLTSRIPAGTYVSKYGPSGVLGYPLVSEKHVMRLTVKARNAYEAEVLVETEDKKPNPLFPWLMYSTVDKETVVKRGTLRVSTFEGKDFVDFGEGVGSFAFSVEAGKLTLTNSFSERHTELRLDADYQAPAEPTAKSLSCVSRYVDRGDAISITLDRDQGQSGTATVTTRSSRSEWPKAGKYQLAYDEQLSGNGWKEWSGTAAGKNPITVRFPARELESGRGSFDAAGSYYVGDTLMGGDFHLSLRCTHR